MPELLSQQKILDQDLHNLEIIDYLDISCALLGQIEALENVLSSHQKQETFGGRRQIVIDDDDNNDEPCYRGSNGEDSKAKLPEGKKRMLKLWLKDPQVPDKIHAAIEFSSVAQLPSHPAIGSRVTELSIYYVALRI